MDAKFGVAIPVTTAVTIHERLNKLREELNKKIIATEKKIANGNPKAIDERKVLIAKLNRLTPSNMIRLAAIVGAGTLSKVSDDDVFEQIMENGLARGRKKHAA